MGNNVVGKMESAAEPKSRDRQNLKTHITILQPYLDFVMYNGEKRKVSCQDVRCLLCGISSEKWLAGRVVYYPTGFHCYPCWKRENRKQCLRKLTTFYLLLEYEMNGDIMGLIWSLMVDQRQEILITTYTAQCDTLIESYLPHMTKFDDAIFPLVYPTFEEDAIDSMLWQINGYEILLSFEKDGDYSLVLKLRIDGQIILHDLTVTNNISDVFNQVHHFQNKSLEEVESYVQENSTSTF